MLSLMQKQLDEIITEYGYVDLNEYISDYHLIIIDFQQNSHSNANAKGSQMIFHLIYFPSMKIVSYIKPIQSIGTVIDNFQYCNGVNLVECMGEKCREFNDETFCKSCYDADYLEYYELFNLIKDAKVFDDKLLIYTQYDYEEILPDIMALFTNTYACQECDCESHSLININEKKRNELFDIVYSAFVNEYSPLQKYNHNLIVGPMPCELPIPKKLLSI